MRASLDSPLPDPLWVGRGSALLLAGTIEPGSGRTTKLALIAGADRCRVSCSGGRWWAILGIPAIAGPESRQLRLVAGGGGPARSVELGTLELVDEPPGFDVPVSGARIAICMASWEPDRAWFQRQVDSIRAQTRTDWVCLISDDHSSDEAVAAMREVLGDDPRFVLSRSERRLGFYRNFERAMSMVPPQAELIAPCDQDDRWDADKLEALFDTLQRSPRALLAYSDMRLVSERMEPISDSYWVERRNSSTDLASVLFANTVTGAASLFRRELLDDVLPFPSPPGQPYHDHWIALCALAQGELAYLDRATHDRTRHQSSVTVSERAASTRRPRLRRLYFERYLGLVVLARSLELRLGARIPAGKRRVLRRVIEAERGVGGLGWLGLRSMRPWLGWDETLARERLVLAGLLWRKGASIRALSSRARRGSGRAAG